MSITARALDRAAPSTIENLRECGYRVALSQHGQGHSTSNPWARLGTVCHQVFAEAARGNLGGGDPDEFDALFTQSWQNSIEAQAAEASQSAAESLWGQPLKWPTYSDRRVRLKRVARDLAVIVASWTTRDLLVEECLFDDERSLFGTPDLIVREPEPHRVIDLKTGVITTADGELNERYRRQILLYAHLEERTFGRLPSKGVVMPLKGAPQEFALRADEVADCVDDALALVSRFNEHLGNPADLANPSESVCGRCAFAAHCGPFWEAAPSLDPSKLGALEGSVIMVAHPRSDLLNMKLDNQAGNLPKGPTEIRGIQGSNVNALADLSHGDTVRIVGVRSTGPEGGYYSCAPSASVGTADAE